MNNIINLMKNLGLTEYEVKAYLSLLENNPLNGYALSKQSGIPRSRIYEIIDSLKKKQIIFEHLKDSSASYSPLEPKLLINKLTDEFNETIKAVESYTYNLYNNEEINYDTKILKGRTEIIEIIKLLINESTKNISLSIWDEELILLKEHLNNAKERKVSLRGICFGKDNSYSELINHRRMERYIAEQKERYIIVIIDNKHVIFGIISRNQKAQVTWSNDPGIIEISEDFIAHDVMINSYNKLLSIDEREKYERALDKVRKEYYNYTDEEYKLFPKP